MATEQEGMNHKAQVRGSNPWMWAILLALITVVIVVVEFGLDRATEPETTEETALEEGMETASNESATTMSVEEAKSEVVTLTMSTSKGDIALALYPNVAPKTVENFVKLANEGTYTDTAFHRVISSFMIQGGDPQTQGNPNHPLAGTGGPGYQFEDEINAASLGVPANVIAAYEAQGYSYRDDLTSLPNVPGAISMANSGPNTNGSQFFIITEAPQPHLDGKHTVFGEVTEGMDVVRSIEQGDTITSITVAE